MGYKITWHTTKHEGVVYREHPTRKNGPHPDRYYALRYRDASKKRHMEALGWASKKMTADKARDILAEIQENIRLGQGFQSVAERRDMLKSQRQAEAERIEQAVTFGYVAGLFIAWAKGHKKSWRDDQQRINTHLLPVLGEALLDDITYSTIESLKQELQDKDFTSPRNKAVRKLAPQTVIHCLGLVREIFNYALQCDRPGTTEPIWEGTNPAVFRKKFGRGVTPPRNNNRRLRIISDQEVQHMFDFLAVRITAANKEKREWLADLRDIIAISLDTGLRAGEVLSLTWTCVNMERSEIHTLVTKGGCSRTVYFSGVCQLARDAMLERAGQNPGARGLIFPGRDNALRDYNTISRRFRELCEDCGINSGIDDRRLRAVFHTLRHTHATRMLEQGVDIYILNQLMGHKDLSTTQRYLHLCDRVKREEALRAGKNATVQHQQPRSPSSPDTPATLQ